MEWSEWKFEKENEKKSSIKREFTFYSDRVKRKIELEESIVFDENNYRVFAYKFEVKLNGSHNKYIIADDVMENRMCEYTYRWGHWLPFPKEREEIIKHLRYYLSEFGLSLEGTLLQEGWEKLPSGYRKIIHMWKLIDGGHSIKYLLGKKAEEGKFWTEWCEIEWDGVKRFLRESVNFNDNFSAVEKVIFRYPYTYSFNIVEKKKEIPEGVPVRGVQVCLSPKNDKWIIWDKISSWRNSQGVALNSLNEFLKVHREVLDESLIVKGIKVLPPLVWKTIFLDKFR